MLPLLTLFLCPLALAALLSPCQNISEGATTITVFQEITSSETYEFVWHLADDRSVGLIQQKCLVLVDDPSQRFCMVLIGGAVEGDGVAGSGSVVGSGQPTTSVGSANASDSAIPPSTKISPGVSSESSLPSSASSSQLDISMSTSPESSSTSAPLALTSVPGPSAIPSSSAASLQLASAPAPNESSSAESPPIPETISSTSVPSLTDSASISAPSMDTSSSMSDTVSSLITSSIAPVEALSSNTVTDSSSIAVQPPPDSSLDSIMSSTSDPTSSTIPSISSRPSSPTGSILTITRIPSASILNPTTSTSLASADLAAAAASITSTPGQKMQVLPIGLGVVGGLVVVTLAIVGYVMYERRKYKRQFRTRKLAEGLKYGSA